jgi:undecaprenyl-diphosphatase
MFPRRPSRASLILFALFVIISVLVVSAATNAWDVAGLKLVASYRTSGWTTIMRTLSVVGDWQVEVPFVLLLAGLLWSRHRSRDARTYLLACVSGEALYALLKATFRRPRPSIIPHLAGAGWYSYPSGHSMLAPVIWGLGLLLLATLTESRPVRALCRLFAVVIVAGIGLSRIYLGVHYPTDVLAGLCIGLAWMLWWSVAVGKSSSAAPRQGC